MGAQNSEMAALTADRAKQRFLGAADVQTDNLLRGVAGALTFPVAAADYLTPRFRVSGGSSVTAGTTLTLTKPAGTAPGDGVVAVLRTDGALPTTPAGWALEGSQAFANAVGSVAVYSRVVGISEPASWAFTFGAAVNAAVDAIVMTGVDPVDMVTAVAFTPVGTATTTYTAPAVVGARYGFNVAAFVSQAAGSVTTTSTPVSSTLNSWSKRIDGNNMSILTRQAGNNKTALAQAATRTVSETGMAVSLSVSCVAPTFANSFEGGDLNGWTQSLQGGPAAPVIIADPFSGISSRKLCQFEVLGGQTRQELMTGGTGAASGDPIKWAEGDDLYFGMAYWLDPAWPVGGGNSWQIVHQWMMPPATGTETAGMGLAAGMWGNDNWILSAAGWPSTYNGEGHTLMPVKRGVWTRFVFRILFTEVAANAKVQVWGAYGRAPLTLVFDSDNKKVETINGIVSDTRRGWRPSFAVDEVAGSNGGTMRMGSPGGYEKHGIYRDSAITAPARLLSAGVRWGRSLAEVLG